MNLPSSAPELFHPVVRHWFTERFGQPTEPQRLGWPRIDDGQHVLIAAPTGSGKTLAAFLVCMNRLLRQSLAGQLEDRVHVVYVSPLKALGNDIQRNLRTPLSEISALLSQAGDPSPRIRTAVRTGDTPASERQAMLRSPPHILVTTPESLYLLLTAEKSRKILDATTTVIVDEIHALARDKRGSHLSLTLARLDRLCQQPPQRIGLSATQSPIEEIACFLVGTNNIKPSGEANCSVIDIGHARDLDLAVEVPPSPLQAVCSNDQWSEIYQRLTELVLGHRSTLIFVNTRRLAERVAHFLTETLGEDAVASHHGSLSKRLRQSAEQRLKAGTLKAIVATASLEMGIDVGFIDLVCQIGSPRAIATFLQRVGRSGHSLGALPRGRLFPLTRDELIECTALVRAVRRGTLDRIEIPAMPLDILAQQIVASVACDDYREDDLLELCRGAWPFHRLTRERFESVLKMLSDGLTPKVRHGRHLHRDAINGRVRARRGARLAAITSGGAIPETTQFRVITEGDETYVGQLDEDFAIESQSGDIFLLGNTSWQVVRIREGQVIVRDANGAPPNIPFWFGEAPGRTVELSEEISILRDEVARQISESETTESRQPGEAVESLMNACPLARAAAAQIVDYVATQKAAIGLVPTQRQIVFERFFDESGGMQLVIHSPLGARINRAWGLALRKRFCRSFDFELQAAATDDGIVLSIGPQHSFPIEGLFRMLTVKNGRYLLEQALLAVPMFQVRWRWNITRALVVLRHRFGKKVPPYLQRFQSDDLLAAVFPETVGCLENHSGDVTIPDHPLVSQTLMDCLHEAMDLDRWLRLLGDIESGKVELVARETREPSPFCHELLNANPYAFLDDAPLEERRTRAVAARRRLSTADMRDLGRLDSDAIAQVTREAAPLVRDVEELHEALYSLVAVTEQESLDWKTWLDDLANDRRAAQVLLTDGTRLWIAAERWPWIRALWPEAKSEPFVQLPPEIDGSRESTEALVELVRGRISVTGPVTVTDLAAILPLETSRIASALESLEGDGTVLRGEFRPESDTGADFSAHEKPVQWCDRRLLARIHRLTLSGLRRQIQPVEPSDFMRFLLRRHHLLTEDPWGGAVALREIIQMLQGLELPAAVWESRVLSMRLHDYDPQWLDELFSTGELVWGRLRGPKLDPTKRSSLTMRRALPTSLSLREDLCWLLPEDRDCPQDVLGRNARAVYEALVNRGALFLQELKLATRLLDSHLEEGLRELAAVGLITSDSYESVRCIVSRKSRSTRRANYRGRNAPKTASMGTGRWSLFPGPYVPDRPDDHSRRWCWQLLKRWGLLFRELLVQESVAPPWHQLVPILRTLERRGEIRGGRFVNGVGGEQFALPDAVEQLRQVRDVNEVEPWIAISAADPVNLTGLLNGDENRVPAVHTNALVLHRGRCVASRRAGEVTFCDDRDFDPQTRSEMERALCQGRRPTSTQLSTVRVG